MEFPKKIRVSAPPHGKRGSDGEPPVSGWSKEQFEHSECGRNIEKYFKLFYQYPDETDPFIYKYWAGKGIKKELFDADKNDGVNKYSVFSPIDVEKGKKYPVLYYSHGGMRPIYEAEFTGFNQLIPIEKFIAVYPNNGGPSNEDVITEFPRIIKELEIKGYPIDRRRIYASGFSSGSDATESIATCWPEMVAAVSPSPGSNAMRNSFLRGGKQFYEKNLDLQVPFICVGGTADFGDKYPFSVQECYDNYNIWMEVVAKVANFSHLTMEKSQRLAVTSDDPSIKACGLEFQRTYIEHFEGTDWYFGEFFDKGGIVVARYVMGNGVPHRTTGSHAEVVWDFLKHFSRNENSKEIVFTPLIVGGM